jgi:hypothetical protein
MHGFVPFFISLVPNLKETKTHDSFPHSFAELKRKLQLNYTLNLHHGMAWQGKAIYILISVHF